MRLFTIVLALACLVFSGASALAQSDSGPATRWFEIDSLNGYVVQLAEAQGVPCVEHARLVDEVRALVAARDAAKA